MNPLNEISTGDVGFDLVLGEKGLLEVDRADGRRSATILIRGAPGSGKSAMALHLALVAAAKRNVAVGYACVELLPSELQALTGSLWPQRGVKFVSSPTLTDGQQVVAKLLVPDENGLPDLAEFLDALVARCAPNGQPVLVIDSLLRDSELGSAATRETVDAVCKYAAATGAILILVEESLGGPSPWMWSVDTVLELAQPVGAATSDRTLVVSKHRFGPCDPGPHYWAFSANGLEVFPRCAAYLRPWAEQAPRREIDWVLRVPSPTAHEVGLGKLAIPTTISVVAADPSDTSRVGKLFATSITERLAVAYVGHSYVDFQFSNAVRSVPLSQVGESIERGCARAWSVLSRTAAEVVLIMDLARLEDRGGEATSVELFIEGLRRRGMTTVVAQTARVDAVAPGWSMRLPPVLRACEIATVSMGFGYVDAEQKREGKWHSLELYLRRPSTGSEEHLFVR